MDKLQGKHRLVFDTTTPAGFGAAVAYANNFLTADKDGYGLTDQDHGIIIVARHFATTFAYNDAMWAKYGKAMPPFVVIDDPKTKQRPTINLYNVGTYGLDLPNLGTTIPDVVKRGVHFAVCQMATKFFSGMLAQATGGTADAVYNEIVANLVGNSHMAAAGIVAVNRAQEHGYTLSTAF
jgi:intracellular sulfur oxidation DsrE/DsrF family protein